MNTPKLKEFGVFLCGVLAATATLAFTPSTQPPQSTAVPGNLLLTLSVEHPTGLQVSYEGGYSTVTNYDGYFDNRKCYTYNTTNEVFRPTSAANANRSCPSAATEWNGNLLNWLTMTNLDQFRSVMTGGTRDDFSAKSGTYPGDTTERTVLIRSFSDRPEYNPNKQILTTTPGVPTGLRTVNRWVRSAGYGSKFIINNVNNNWANWDGTDQRDSCADSPLPGARGTSQCFNIRVEVCVAVGGVPREANCQARYSGVAKPEGLIQEYANSLRFGAFGYLNQSGNDRNGGVLRAAMKSVGSLAATRTGVVENDRREWNATTGILWPNPDSDDATASGVVDSGVINYLNKFGYTAGYKSNDPVSELFYAAQRYLRGYSLPTEYTNDLTNALRDGFPVITGTDLTRGRSRDPIINSCQKNFMLAIGDIYTHCDGNLPGSTRANCPGGTPTDPDNLNVETLWDNLRDLETNPSLPDARDVRGVNGWAGGSGNPTPYVAALAHWANTNDVRSDMSNARGEQRISTYFVDVIERGNEVGGLPTAATLRSQYWLAAKYGGFKTDQVPGNNPNVNTRSWDADGNGVPDTWFAGSTPSLLRSGLSRAFADIAFRGRVNSASSAAVSSSRQTSDSQIIYAGYNPQDWSGTLRACRPTQTATECENSPTWEASRWFDINRPDRLAPADRKIITSWRSATSFSSMPFKWENLNTAQRAALQPSDTRGEDRLNYLRGVRTNEVSVFRSRHDKLLGDIVNSGVTYVAGQGPAYFGTAFAGHSVYRSSNKDRPPVVYVGANDGMLHAFSATDGKELFGYIPSTVYPNLAGLSDLNFQHKFFVDSTPMVADFQRTGTTWGTMLVGGLGAGGRGYYALDITNQSGFATASENVLSAIPMWEFTSAQDSDLGYTFNEPSIDPVTGANLQIAKVADATVEEGVWRVIVGNGFGSANGDAVLFMLNARTGDKDIELLAHNGADNGLATPTPIDTDRDGLIDTIYAGDLEGNLHKFQFSKLQSGSYVLASPSDSGGQWRHLGIVLATGQAVTTAPSVEKGDQGWIVSFGTGKLNEDSDYTDSTSPYGFYSVLDNEPSSSLTVDIDDLAEIEYESTNLDRGLVGRTWTPPNLLDKKGWWMEFRNGERVLSNSTIPPDTGTVLFATTRPSGDACDPNNSGFIMGVKLESGASNTLNVNGDIVGGIGVNSTGTVKLSPTYTGTDNEQKVLCNQDGCKPPPPEACDPQTDPDCTCQDANGNPVTCEGPPGVLGSGAPRGRYNWREILTK